MIISINSSTLGLATDKNTKWRLQIQRCGVVRDFPRGKGSDSSPARERREGKTVGSSGAQTSVGGTATARDPTTHPWGTQEVTTVTFVNDIVFAQ